MTMLLYYLVPGRGAVLPDSEDSALFQAGGREGGRVGQREEEREKEGEEMEEEEEQDARKNTQISIIFAEIGASNSCQTIAFVVDSDMHGKKTFAI